MVPHNRMAEEALIGSVLINPTKYRMISLKPGDFYIHRNMWIWEAFGNLPAIDFITVTNELEKMGRLEEIGGPAYLTELINNTPSALHADEYAKKVRDTAERRDQIGVANQIAKQAYDESKPMNISGIVKSLTENIRVDGGTIEIKEILDKPEDYLANIQQRKDCILSPWEKFNAMAGGIYKRQTTLIAGGPDLGKSVFVGKYGLYAASQNFQVDIYEIEMDEEDLILRWVSDLSGIPTAKLKTNDLTMSERSLAMEKFDYIKSLKIRISDGTHWNSMSIRADLTRKSYRNPPDLVIVDSVGQLRELDNKKWDRVETAVFNLKHLAKELNCSMLLIATIVKDGSIRGTKEVEHICDYWYSFERPAGAEYPESLDYWVRNIYPGKKRHGGKQLYCKLKMAEDLPRLYVPGEVYETKLDDMYYD